jgi:hypothetical protein
VIGLLAGCLGLGMLAWSSRGSLPPAHAARAEFTVQGLDCALWCAVRLRQGVDEPGVAWVESLEPRTGNVVVRYLPERVDPAALQQRLAARGFRVVGGR